jgi:hypothetical protein
VPELHALPIKDLGVEASTARFIAVRRVASVVRRHSTAITN